MRYIRKPIQRNIFVITPDHGSRAKGLPAAVIRLETGKSHLFSEFSCILANCGKIVSALASPC